MRLNFIVSVHVCVSVSAIDSVSLVLAVVLVLTSALALLCVQECCFNKDINDRSIANDIAYATCLLVSKFGIRSLG